MPPRATAPPGRIPRCPGRLVQLGGGLPEREILRVLFGVVVLRDACARLEFARVQARQLAVAREAVDREIHRPVVGAVGHALGLESRDEPNHLRDVGRRTRVVLGCLNPEPRTVPLKEFDNRIRDLADRLASFASAPDDLVVDVGQVHHLIDTPPRPAQRAPQQVFEQKRAKVAEVRGVVDRGAAGVQPDDLAVCGHERLDRSRHRVVEAEAIASGRWSVGCGAGYVWYGHRVRVREGGKSRPPPRIGSNHVTRTRLTLPSSCRGRSPAATRRSSSMPQLS